MSTRRVSKQTRAEAVAYAAETYGVSPSTVLIPWHGRISSHPRQLAMWALRQRQDAEGHALHSFPAIGAAFSMDHTSVIHAVRQVDKRLLAGKLTISEPTFLLPGSDAGAG